MSAMSHGWSKDGILSSLFMTTNDVSLGCPGAVHNSVSAMSHGWSKDGILSSLFMTTNDVIVAGECNFEGRFLQPVSNVTLCTVLSILMHVFLI